MLKDSNHFAPRLSTTRYHLVMRLTAWFGLPEEAVQVLRERGVFRKNMGSGAKFSLPSSVSKLLAEHEHSKAMAIKDRVY